MPALLRGLGPDLADRGLKHSNNAKRFLIQSEEVAGESAARVCFRISATERHRRQSPLAITEEEGAKLRR
jgi:hypothetical protein